MNSEAHGVRVTKYNHNLLCKDNGKARAYKIKDYFHELAIVNSASMNIRGVCIFFNYSFI